ncbi:hypothetical protein C475_08817 [Halosimplex carlsbadense 2-9-1]|uniref:Uncharacterized protein n=1 Tax=Halosimplex carlsbadense 2-9-1 TaxID=797114 RepID=M0CTF9_9EURY|nr:hypothetical protein [Halosimplex carlsbadense]ELZ26515.1 hypothetical protein C475_08817 [Halosimplex carlsbadense 2-9-1]
MTQNTANKGGDPDKTQTSSDDTDAEQNSNDTHPLAQPPEYDETTGSSGSASTERDAPDAGDDDQPADTDEEPDAGADRDREVVDGLSMGEYLALPPAERPTLDTDAGDADSDTENITRGDGIAVDGVRSEEDMALEMTRSEAFREQFRDVIEGVFHDADVVVCPEESTKNIVADGGEETELQRGLRVIDIAGTDWLVIDRDHPPLSIPQRVRERREDELTGFSIRYGTGGGNQSEYHKLVRAHRMDAVEPPVAYAFGVHAPVPDGHRNDDEYVPALEYICLINGRKLARLLAEGEIAHTQPIGNTDASGTGDGTQAVYIPPFILREHDLIMWETGEWQGDVIVDEDGVIHRHAGRGYTDYDCDDRRTHDLTAWSDAPEPAEYCDTCWPSEPEGIPDDVLDEEDVGLELDTNADIDL